MELLRAWQAPSRTLRRWIVVAVVPRKTARASGTEPLGIAAILDAAGRSALKLADGDAPPIETRAQTVNLCDAAILGQVYQPNDRYNWLGPPSLVDDRLNETGALRVSAAARQGWTKALEWTISRASKRLSALLKQEASLLPLA